jgi:hypothetical protein
LSPPPTVAITAPAAGAFLASGVVSVQVTAAQPLGSLTNLQLFSGTHLISTLTLNPGTASFSGTISGSIPPGPQNLFVTATDNNGQTATAGPVPIMAQSPNFLIALTSPGNGATFRPFPTIPLVVSASSPNATITNVNIFMDGALIASLTSPPFSFSVPQVYPGTHQFYAQAFDALGFGGESSGVSVTVAAPAKNYMAAFTSTNGTLSFGFAGEPASGYVLETADSLTPPVDWVPAQTKLLSSAQSIFSDPNYTQYLNRYYRIVPLNSSVGHAPAFSVWSQPDPKVTSSGTYNLMEGASLDLTNLNGIIFNLNIPGGALGLTQPATMTSVTNLQDYPFAGPMVGAVEIWPSEIDLFTPATLIIQLPTNITASQVAAFTYHVPNGELFLTPFSVTNVVVGSVTNSAIALQINRTGGYGLAALDTADLSLAFQYSPSDPADSLDQNTTLYVLENPASPAARPVKTGGPGGVGPDDEAIIQQLLDQFDSIYAQMQADEASGQVSSCDLSTWARWYQAVQAYTTQSLGLQQFSLQLAEFAQALANIYQVAITKLTLKADSQHDWDTISRLLVLDLSGKLNAPVVAPGWQPGQQAALQQAVDDCLTFEFDFDTSLENDSDIGTETSHLTVQVTFSEGNPSTTKQIKGQSAVQWQETDFPPIPKCGGITASPTTPNFLMFGFNPGGQSSTSSDNCSSKTTYNVTFIQTIFWPGLPKENFTTTCEGFEVPLPVFWLPEFGILYEDDLNGFPKKGGTPAAAFYVQDNWQIQGGGGNPVLATRQGSATKTLSGSDSSATITETSTWTLKHTPQ